ncbi:MAG: hypothetical protein KC464_21975, partial [Myxococcales bacterium]|nr:hypothetical protein [Myxococcales bacterium]
VDGVARGVAVGPGEHVAIFHYAPPRAATGRWITLASVLALIALVAASRRSRRGPSTGQAR